MSVGSSQATEGKSGGGSFKRVSALALGILASIGGFVDFGGIVTSTQAGAQFGLGLVWTLIVGVIGFSVFAEMSARVTISTSRTLYDVIRERLGARIALIPLISTTLSQILTVFIEIAGMSLVVEYVSSLSYLLWLPLAALLVAAIVWFAGFEVLDNSTAILGFLMLVALVVMARALHDWGAVSTSLVHPPSDSFQPLSLYLFTVVSLIGAYMTPYQFAFYSSGALEEEWTGKDLATNRLVAIVGTSFGAVVALALTVDAAIYLYPHHISVNSFASLVIPTKTNLGMIGVAVFLGGTFVLCLGAGLEALLSGSYSVMQYFGWSWGKKGRPRTAPLFHLGMLFLLLLAVLIGETRVDPIQMTTMSMVVAAMALPFNFIPLLLVASDESLMGEQRNRLGTNLVSIAMVVLLSVITIAAIPLLFLSGTV